MWRVGVFMGIPDNSEGQARVAAFRQALQVLGWSESRNIQFDYRWSVADAMQARQSARELLDLRPDVILANSTLDINIKNNSGIASGAAIRFIDSGNGYSGGGIYFSSSNAITYATSSDRRIKEGIKPTVLGLDKLMAIEVDDFNFIGERKDKRLQGSIAQDLVKIYPEAVKVGGEGKDTNPWSVDYGRGAQGA
jgi:hypothetical protein